MALQCGNRLHDLQSISDISAQRTVHIGDQGDDFPSHVRADIHHLPGQHDGIVQRLHKCAASRLHIQKNAVGTGGDLLGHDAGRNQGNIIHRGSYVPERIQLLIRRRQVPRLSGHGDTDLFHHIEEFRLVQRRCEARYGLQLIQSTARVSQSSAGKLRHRNAAGSRHRPDHHGGLVSHAAGGVFIHLDSGNG